MERITRENEFFDIENNSDYGDDIPQLMPEDIVWPAGDRKGVEAPAIEINRNAADTEVINILLIGQDKRPGEKRARSDALIIASYSKKDGALKLFSLMRDMYVPIPGYSDNRINAAYQFGGMELLDKTIKKAFGITVDGNIEVSFESFTQLIDMLGGLDIELNKAEAAHLNLKFGWKLSEGHNHLNGDETLEYARIRHVGHGDFERTDRQRTVLAKIFENAKGLSLAKQYQMLDKMLPCLTTDMTKQEILGYAYAVLTGGVKGTESHRIPMDGAYKTAKIRKMAVLVPNLAKARAFLKACVYE